MANENYLVEKAIEKEAVKMGQEKEEKVVYKNPVVFLRKSKAGKHLFVYDSRHDLVAGATLIMNVSEVEELIRDGREWIKVGILPPEIEAEDSASE